MGQFTSKPSGRLKTLLALITVAFAACAQNVGVKTNLLGDAALSPNLGIEIGLAPKWTLDIPAEINFWTVGDGHRWKHWAVQPEARYWFCERFAGHFIGVHALGGEFNVGKIGIKNLSFLGTDFSKLSDKRYQGWGVGAGVAYGYAWPIAKHWNMEAEIGVGWVWTKSDVYPCAKCGTKIREGLVHNYVGPTKLNLSLIYLF